MPFLELAFPVSSFSLMSLHRQTSLPSLFTWIDRRMNSNVQGEKVSMSLMIDNSISITTGGYIFQNFGDDLVTKFMLFYTH
jgi:hypothetical protein